MLLWISQDCEGPLCRVQLTQHRHQIKHRPQGPPDKVASQDDKVRPEKIGQSDCVLDNLKRGEGIKVYIAE